MNYLTFQDGEYNILANDKAKGSDGKHTNYLLVQMQLYIQVYQDRLVLMDLSVVPAVPATVSQVSAYLDAVDQSGIWGQMFPGYVVRGYLQAFINGPIVAQSTPGAPGPGILP